MKREIPQSDVANLLTTVSELTQAPKKVIHEFDHMAQEVIQDVRKNVKGSGEQLINDFNKQFEAGVEKGIKALPIPEQNKEQFRKVGQQVGNMISEIARETLNQGINQGVEFSMNLLVRMIETAKIVFENISKLVMGEKTQAQTLEGIKSSWHKAEESLKEKTSFVDRIGGKKQETEKFTDQVGTKGQREEQRKERANSGVREV